MKDKKHLAVAAAVFCVFAILMGTIWMKSRPSAQSGMKQVAVEVIHKDGTEKKFEYQTDLEYLGELLLEEGLISGTTGAYGLFVKTVDGETADYAEDQGWWRLDCNGEQAQTGADSMVLQDGDVYTWVYTIG